MAKQVGLLKLRGAIGGITYYKTRHGYLARESSRIDVERVATDPVFQRTREHASEFGRCVRYGALLVRAFKSVVLNASDGKVGNRMTQRMFKAKNADFKSAPGFRNCIDGDLGFVEDFEFNDRSSFACVFGAPVLTTIDRTSGIVSFSVASFLASKVVFAPTGGTHFKIISAVAAVDFDAGTFEISSTETAALLLNSIDSVAVHHLHSVLSVHPLFLVVGISFHQEMEGNFTALNGGLHNAFRIVAIA
ncbi:hypothetical protein FLAN108750_10435 [Flavobacterium antarcticum]|uniref:hypothetical protein n=1 Tax=Flavobacterium antarcticum TaxID=271155 RepID=UPI0003B3EE77|nr:hypothetical protein [Flavobacterium antarcticum]